MVALRAATQPTQPQQHQQRTCTQLSPPIPGYDKVAADKQAMAAVNRIGCHHTAGVWFLTDGKTARCHICHPGPDSPERQYIGVSREGVVTVNGVVVIRESER